MKQSIVQRELDEGLEASEIVRNRKTQRRQPSYHPTPWSMINNILDVVDELTDGRAGLAQRFFSFVCIGGFAACVNLLVFYIMDHFVNLPVTPVIHNAIVFIIASEISLIANFIPNDYFTFRHMAGDRSWRARCARFHLTALTGTALTYLVQFSFNFFLHVPGFFAQASALIIVLFYNFTFHHLFTYRHKKSVTAATHSPKSEVELVKQAIAEQLKLDVDTGKFASVDAISSR